MTDFASTDVSIPRVFKEHFDNYCLTHSSGSRSRPENSPFPRNVDMWFLAMCLCIHKGINPDFDQKGDSYKGIPGSVFSSDDWREKIIKLIAIAHTEDIRIVEDPNEMMKIACAYANAGLPLLIDILKNRGVDSALDTICDSVADMLESE